MRANKPGNPFKGGDKVRRRRGTLGNMDGNNQSVGIVQGVVMKGDDECLTVVWPNGNSECFLWSQYERA